MKLCECGCGQPTVINTHTDRSHGRVKGEPRRFLAGHNNRLRRSGYDVQDRGYITMCWIWKGAVNDRGYGRAWGGAAHRVFYERHVGPVPKGLTIDHLCRVRRCVNPDHLEPVTHGENMRRASLAYARAHKETDRTGTRALRAILGLTQKELASQLGVSQPLVSMWEKGKQPIAPEHKLMLDVMRREMAEAA